MKWLKLIFTVVLSATILSGCQNYCKCSPDEPALALITKAENGTPQVTPKEIIAYPGQELLFFSKEDFTLTFYERDPEKADSVGNPSFPSSDGELILVVDEDYIISDPGETERALKELYAAKKIVVPADKKSTETKKYVTIQYSIVIDGKELDPKVKIIKK
ncbi:hypothetical protein [Teredinibacter waterburyi]|uniref:hypothetical protein n=1 Tax=Teredinibacter waterburyi TaxID=1500538 RepID=UPI00165F14B1|nr:hypothetical protein [Teredinibacter waterburyi]